MKCKLEFLYNITKEPMEYVELHQHNCSEMVYYLKGSGFTSINGIQYQYTTGSFSIMLPGDKHDQKHDERTEVLFIGFENSGLDITLCRGVYKDTDGNLLRDLLEKMKTEFKDRFSHYEIAIDGLLRSLLVQVERAIHKPVNRFMDFSYTIKFIEENCSQKINFTAIAELSGFSYSRFRSLFKSSTGLSPINYVIYQRIEKSKRILTTTSKTISTIAQECGFYDHSQFSRYFSKLVNLTPNQYRMKMK